MSNDPAQRGRRRDWAAFIRSYWLFVLGVAGAALIGLLALHVDLRQALVNPVLLAIGVLIVGLHLLGALIAALMTRFARRR